jgi:hypothetical protein
VPRSLIIPSKNSKNSEILIGPIFAKRDRGAASHNAQNLRRQHQNGLQDSSRSVIEGSTPPIPISAWHICSLTDFAGLGSELEHPLWSGRIGH